MSATRPIAQFTLSSSTPLLIGGFDSLACREIEGVTICEGVRSQSVKGVWRWFTRAVVAGALYSSGFALEKLEQRTIELVSNLLGYAGSVHSWSSKLRLEVYTDRDMECDSNTIQRLKIHQRIALMQLGRREYVLNKNMCRDIDSATVALYPRTGTYISAVEEAVAVSSLLLSFIIGCLGKGSRRGLGCFDIDIKLQHKDSLPPYIGRTGLTQQIIKREPLGPGTVANLIAFAWRNAAAYANVKVSAKAREMLPPVPSIAPGAFRLFYAKLDNKSPLDMAIAFSKTVTRSRRAQMLGVDTKKDHLYVKRIAWVLGLPRSQPRTGTGYIIQDDEVQRRASPFMLSVHRGYALLSVFYSTDWPKRLLWSNHDEKVIEIDNSAGEVIIDKERLGLRDAIDEALNVVLDAMNRQGYRFDEVNINWQ